MTDEEKDKKIQNRTISGLRDLLWESIEKVKNKEIDLDRAAVIIKGADTIIATYKMELMQMELFKKLKPAADAEQAQLEHKDGEKTEAVTGGGEGSAQAGDQGMAAA